MSIYEMPINLFRSSRSLETLSHGN